jgi:hypothetical protein
MPLVALFTLAAACGDSANLVAPDISASVSYVPVPLAFDYVKVEDGGGMFTWKGNVSGGDIDGTLTTAVVGVRFAGPIAHLSTIWIVTKATIPIIGVSGTYSFVAELDGTLDTRTGKLRLNGEVVSGALVGSQIRTVGQLTGGAVGVSVTTFEGSGRLMVGSSAD